MAITLNGTTGITTPDVDSTDLTATGNFTSRGIDDNATSTAMTLDTSGNVLVGKTSTGYNSGTEISYEDFIRVNRTNGSALYVGRNSSDGELVSFRKDGSTVGSIGVINSNNLTINGIASNHTGLQFGTSIIWPMRDSANADGTVDLGTTSGRFKDLYLSGGVYLGGVGAANKLDSYEEGTFTPTVTGSATAGTTTYTGQAGYYTKIGRLVNITCIVNWSSMTGAGFMELKGIPYAIANLGPGSQNYPIGAALPSNINWTGGTMFVGLGITGTSTIALYGSSDDGGATRQNCVNESANFRLTMSYMTT